ncbi:PKD-like domain-containing protein [Neolewinella agarilytica]|uniref:PKD-like domain-containing protein n=1 Tax=Neolewinella agarilytica TaxID=478744 RepID=UPI002355B1C8|nr:PKD-like domain-containing protein [Neolewinella agarilytica]
MKNFTLLGRLPLLVVCFFSLMATSLQAQFCNLSSSQIQVEVMNTCDAANPTVFIDFQSFLIEGDVVVNYTPVFNGVFEFSNIVYTAEVEAVNGFLSFEVADPVFDLGGQTNNYIRINSITVSGGCDQSFSGNEVISNFYNLGIMSDITISRLRTVEPPCPGVPTGEITFFFEPSTPNAGGFTDFNRFEVRQTPFNPNVFTTLTPPNNPPNNSPRFMVSTNQSLVTGEYTFLINDLQTGCETPYTVSIGGMFDVTASVVDASCFDVADGEITITPDMADPLVNGPLNWAIVGQGVNLSGVISASSSTTYNTHTEMGLAAGTYQVFLTASGGGCTADETVTIGQPDEIVGMATAATICGSDTDFSVTISGVSGLDTDGRFRLLDGSITDGIPGNNNGCWTRPVSGRELLADFDNGDGTYTYTSGVADALLGCRDINVDTTVVIDLELFDPATGCLERFPFTLQIDAQPVAASVEVFSIVGVDDTIVPGFFCSGQDIEIFIPEYDPAFTYTIDFAGATAGADIDSLGAFAAGSIDYTGPGSVIGNFMVNRNSAATIDFELTTTSIASGCASLPTPFSVQVRPLPTLNPLPSSVLVCSDEVFTVSPVTNGGNNSNVKYDYSWDLTGSGVSFETGFISLTEQDSGDPISASFRNLTGTAQDVTLTITPTFPQNSPLISGGNTDNECQGASHTITVTVSPQPELTYNLVIGSSAPQTLTSGDIRAFEICSGEDFLLNTLEIQEDPGGKLKYVEFKVAGDAGFLQIPPGTAPQYLPIDNFAIGVPNVQNNNPDNNAQVAEITLTPYFQTSFTSPGSAFPECVGAPITLFLTVNPTAPTLVDQSTVVCSDERIEYTIDGASNMMGQLETRITEVELFDTSNDFVIPAGAARVDSFTFNISGADGGGNQSFFSGGRGGNVSGSLTDTDVFPGDTIRIRKGAAGGVNVSNGDGGDATTLVVIAGDNHPTLAPGDEAFVFVAGGGGGAGAGQNGQNVPAFNIGGSSADGVQGQGPGGFGGTGFDNGALGGDGLSNGGGGGGGFTGGAGGNSQAGESGEAGNSFASGGSVAFANKGFGENEEGNGRIFLTVVYDDIRFALDSRAVDPALIETTAPGQEITDGEVDTILWGQQFLNPTDAPLDVTYVFTTNTEANCSDGGTVEITVTVEPEPTGIMTSGATTISGDAASGYTATVCSGDALEAYLSTTIEPTTTVGSVYFLVSTSATPGTGFFGGNGSNASASSDFGGQNNGQSFPIRFFENGVFNNTGAVGTITYTITPYIFQANADDCVGDPFTFTVDVQPGYDNNQLDLTPAIVDVCSEETIGDAGFNLTASQMGVNNPFSEIRLVGYRIGSNSANFIPGADVDTTGVANGGIILTATNAYFNDHSYVNLTGGGVSVEYDIRLRSDDGCESAIITYEFNIRAEPVISPVNKTLTVCSGELLGITVLPASNSAFENNFALPGTNQVTLDYFLDAPNLTFSGSAASMVLDADNSVMEDDAFLNETDMPQTATYKVVGKSVNGCVGDTMTYTITVLPTPSLTYDIQVGAINEELNSEDGPYIFEICSGDDFLINNLTIPESSNGLAKYVELEATGQTSFLGLNVPPNPMNFTETAEAASFSLGATNVQNTSGNNSAQTVTIRITPYFEDGNDTSNLNAGECAGDDIVIIVTLNPTPPVLGPFAEVVCSEERIEFTIPGASNQGGSFRSRVGGVETFDTSNDFVVPVGAFAIREINISLSGANGGAAGSNGGGLGGTVEANTLNDFFTPQFVSPGDTIRTRKGNPGADGTTSGDGGEATMVCVIAGPLSSAPEGSIIQTYLAAGGGGGGSNGAGESVNFGSNDPNNPAAGNGNEGVGLGGFGGTGWDMSDPASGSLGGAGRSNGGGGGGGWLGGDGGSNIDAEGGFAGTSYAGNGPGPIVNGGSFGMKNLGDAPGGEVLMTYILVYNDVRFSLLNRSVGTGLIDQSENPIVDGEIDTILHGEQFFNPTDNPIDVTYLLATSSEASCPGGQVEVTITVEPNPTLALASGTTDITDNLDGTYSAEICSGDSLSAFLSSATMPSTGVNDLRARVVDVTAGPNITFGTSNSGQHASGSNNFGGDDQPAVADVFFFESSIVNVGTTVEEVVYTVVPQINVNGGDNCIGDTIFLTVSVNPAVITVDAGPIANNICSNVSITDSGFDLLASQPAVQIDFDSVMIDTVYNSLGLAGDMNFDTLSSVYSGTPVMVRKSADFFGSDAFRNRTGAPVTVTYEVRLISGPGCFSDPITYTFRYTAEPVILAMETASNQIDTTICTGETTGLVVNPAPNSAWSTPADFQTNVVLNIDAVVPAGITLTGGTYPSSAAGRFQLSNDMLVNTTDVPQDVVYTVTPVNNGCEGDPVVYTVTVNPNPSATVELTSLDSTATFSLDNSRAFIAPNPEFGLCSGQALSTVVPAVATADNGMLMAVLTITVDDDGLSGYTVGTPMRFPASELGDSLSYAMGELENLTGAPQFFTVSYFTFFEGNGTPGNQNDGVDCPSDGSVEFDIVVSPVNSATVRIDDTNGVTIPSGSDTLCSGAGFDLVVRAVTNNAALPMIDSFLVEVDMPTGMVAGMGTESTDFWVTDQNGSAPYGRRLEDLSFENVTAGIKTVQYIAIPYSNGCTGTPDTTTISFRPETVLELQQPIICAQTGVSTSINPVDANGQTLTTMNGDYRWEYIGGTASGFSLTRSNGNGIQFVGDPVNQANTIVFSNEYALLVTPAASFMAGVANFEIIYDNPTNGACGMITDTVTLELSQEAMSGTLDPSLGVLCDGVNFLLTDALIGESPGGVFTDANGTPVPGAPNYTPMIGGSSTTPVAVEFTYTAGGGNSGCTEVSTTFTLMVEPAPSAGSLAGNNGIAEACQGAAFLNLYDLLNGETPGGVFTQTSGVDFITVGADGIFDQTSVTPGTYTYDYEVSSNFGCNNDVISGISFMVVAAEDCSVPVVCDVIELVTGFNIISFDVIPNDNSVRAIFADVIANESLVQIVGLRADANNGIPQTFGFVPVNIPGAPDNYVGEITGGILGGYGYIVQMKQPATIEVCGPEVDEDLRVELQAGPNFVGYVPQASMTVDSYFDELIMDNDLNSVQTFKNGLTQDRVYGVLPFPFGPLFNMDNGFGYIIDVNTAYANGTWKVNGNVQPTSVFDQFYGKVENGKQYVGETFQFTNAAGEVFGEASVNEHGFYFGAYLFGDVSSTEDEVEGFVFGEEVFIMHDGNFIETGITFDGSWTLDRLDINLESETTDIEETVLSEFSVSVYPNPTNGITTVELTLGGEAHEFIRTEVFNALGQLVISRTHDKPAGGFLKTELDLGQLAAGAYQLRLVSDQGVLANQQVVKR